MTAKHLTVYLLGNRVGTLSQEMGGRHWLTYDEDYTGQELSLSLPTTTRRWGPERVEPFIAGLVPEDERVKEKIAREHDVSARNPFSLLSAIGRECAGAVQFLPPTENPNDDARIVPLSDDDVAQRLRQITGPAQDSWMSVNERWSLAGMQSKIALHRDPATSQWCEADGSAATTHIIKPAGPLPLHALNEVLCLRTLHYLGVPAAWTELQVFDGIPAVVSTRWDREFIDGDVLRIHQEDLCQAMHIHPDNKYTSDGGPQAHEIAQFLKKSAPDQRLHEDFTRLLILNVLLGNPDAHAKNYSLIHPIDGPPRLAPAYDIASILPYKPDSTLAMKIGGRNVPREIELRHWHRYAERANVPQRAIDQMLSSIAGNLPLAMKKAIIEAVTTWPSADTPPSGTSCPPS
ncbi:type II toxin-antitoxin system HipA family toxin [Corynebacterium glyciniphilum]|uniref:type II toxin-antitoxin system HipA family toxin n=1 Tax=Corynebacterium glyciniphilum TaxID=1404244 RepID=UPI00264BFE35|nr:type II toxin-antitoxin system HipA family toxin [Corynebacterium glyciniphilum]MDN5683139.1 type II toxin-antitoxin system HipA family toxin [Corynebacterium glyciniphilum]MDN6707228.1 type II toxin-antitoxin system HipA family toxin [Corynebacterium glyciniphilum]